MRKSPTPPPSREMKRRKIERLKVALVSIAREARLEALGRVPCPSLGACMDMDCDGTSHPKC
jgi:hypothetical protein